MRTRIWIESTHRKDTLFFSDLRNDRTKQERGGNYVSYEGLIGSIDIQ